MSDSTYELLKEYQPENRGGKKGRRRCRKRIPGDSVWEVDAFLQNIVGVHHVMVAGIYTNELREEMIRLNVDAIGPIDSSDPA